MIDSTNPRILADNIRALKDESGSQASDISTLQSTVEALGSYSETEVNTGMKYGDDIIFRKVFYRELPNNTTLEIPHGVSNIKNMINLYVASQAIASSYEGRVNPGAGNPAVLYNATNIKIVASTDLSGKYGIIVFEYTKSAAPTPDLSPSPEDEYIEPEDEYIEPEEIPEDEYIEPEVREEAPEEEPIIEEPVAEVKKTTRKKSTN